MDMYTVLLVDDEDQVIQAIIDRIHWGELGFSVIGSANNGVKALEMVEEFQPDVVMTDIKMPYMDGMELANRIKERFLMTRLLIFTGFDEFEYAKEAIHLDVEEYLLKPVNSVELTQVLTRLKVKMDQEISEKRNTELLQTYYKESLPFLQANFYSLLIEGKILEQEIPKYLMNYQITLDGPYYCCLVVHTSSTQKDEKLDTVLLATSVFKQMETRLGEKWDLRSFAYLENRVCIVQLHYQNEVSELTDDCDRFCKYVKHILGASVTIGIGSVCNQLVELVQSYANAREALSYRVIYGTSRALNMHEIAPNEKTAYDAADHVKLDAVLKMIRMGTKDDIRLAVHQYLNHILSAERSMNHYHVDVIELMGALYRFASNNELAVVEFTDDIKNLYGTILNMEQEELRKWMEDICLVFHEKLSAARAMSSVSFVTNAKEYVANHYADEDLSLDDICGVLGLSNSYFSTLFKKETGCSFIGYLTDYRLEQAERLLIETNEKSYVIAQKVGYTDPNYFSYVYKRKFGLSPAKYRTEHERV